MKKQDVAAELKKQKIGGKILTEAKRNLYFAMRFMDMAFNVFSYEPEAENHTAGTDGNRICFYPDFLIGLYRQEERLVNRLYLHMTLHCIYRHLFRLEKRNRRLWDLACDIAVEAIVDGLPYACVAMRLPSYREQQYREIRTQYKVLTADTAYRYLEAQEFSDGELAEMELTYRADDHQYWYRQGENPRTQMKNRQKWEDISSRMQTAMETVEKGAGQEDADLYESVSIENRKRYDYRAFLRKFAVYQEEMQSDPDSFDYTFYTYGLSYYGNMPLIEPQETREVKKIQDFVIVIDTSFSCSDEQVRDFLRETCRILFESESFFKKVRIRILQCDNKIQKDDLLLSQEEMENYIRRLSVKGRGGTDFRPAFEYVAKLLEQGEFTNLKGMIYFTDGQGEYPKKKPPYDAAFIFLKDGYVSSEVPAWAMKLEI